MADFVEREKIQEVISDIYKDTDSAVEGACIEIWSRVKEIPAADVRPVVICKDCKYAQMTIDGLCKYCDRLTEIGVDDAVYLSGDFFCAAGEKREES